MLLQVEEALVGPQKEELMECYDESRWCCYCNLKFKKLDDRVEQDGKWWHKECLSWTTRPKGPPVVSVRPKSQPWKCPAGDHYHTNP